MGNSQSSSLGSDVKAKVAVPSAPEAAPAAAPSAEPAAVADDDAQPSEFPLTFDDWAGERKAWEHTLVQGFRHTVRNDGQLLANKYRRQWAEEFEAYKTSPPR